MSSHSSSTAVVVPACLFQLCYATAAILILAYPYIVYLFVRWLPQGRLSGVIFILAIVLPPLASIQAWFLLSRGRISGWFLSAAIDAVFTLAYAAVIRAFTTDPSPQASGDAPRLLYVMLALPLAHLVVITLPPVYRRLVGELSGPNLQPRHTFLR